MRTVFVLFDSLCRRAMECYGGDMHTPNFTRLAERGVTFDNHYVGSLACMPARRDLNTGHLNFLHRSWGPLEPFDKVFPEIFKQNGIHSHMITDHYHYFEDGGLTYHNRFTTWELERGQEWDPWKAVVEPPSDEFKKTYHPLQFDLPGAAGGRAQSMVNRTYIREEESYSMPRCFDRAFEFLDTNKDADNWFLQLECFDPHEPFAAPARFRERYKTNYEGPILDWPRYKRVEESEDEIAEIRANYAALITMCDEYFGKLIDYFDENNFWDNTSLVLTTDHGFMLAEHDWWAKSRMPFYNEIANIPLLAYHPDHRNLGGQRRSSLTQNIDLMPTFMDSHKIAIPDTVRGHSLLPMLEKDEPVRNVAIYGQFGAATNITDGRYTYFRYPKNIMDQELYEYTLMPTHQNAFFEQKEFEDAQLIEGFAFMRGFPVLKLPSRKDAKRGQGALIEDCDTALYDLETDPGQATPIDNPEIEQRLDRELVKALIKNDAPPEAFTRLNLEVPSVR